MAVYDFVRNQLVTSLGQDFPPPGLMFFLDEWQKHRTEKEPRLRPADMRDVVERALATLQGLYVHLDLKRARRGVDPLSQLRMFKDRITALEPRDSRAFHDIMLGIFKSLGDVPRIGSPTYISAIAFLPLR